MNVEEEGIRSPSPTPARNVRGQLGLAKLQPNTVTYNTYISLCGQAGVAVGGRGSDNWNCGTVVSRGMLAQKSGLLVSSCDTKTNPSPNATSVAGAMFSRQQGCENDDAQVSTWYHPVFLGVPKGEHVVAIEYT